MQGGPVGRGGGPELSGGQEVAADGGGHGKADFQRNAARHLIHQGQGDAGIRKDIAAGDDDLARADISLGKGAADSHGAVRFAVRLTIEHGNEHTGGQGAEGVAEQTAGGIAILGIQQQGGPALLGHGETAGLGLLRSGAGLAGMGATGIFSGIGNAIAIRVGDGGGGQLRVEAVFFFPPVWQAIGIRIRERKFHDNVSPDETRPFLAVTGKTEHGRIREPGGPAIDQNFRVAIAQCGIR